MSYPGAWGLDYEEVQGLCWLAYKGCGTEGLYQLSNGSQWKVTEVIEVGGFRAVLVTGNGKTVLSFAGTDMPEIEDWLNNFMQGVTGASPYYALALALASSRPADVLVGHSLGGGLASYCAVYCGKYAATINPAPLNINLVSAIPIAMRNNLVINYEAIGQALHFLDLVALNMMKVGRINWVASNGSNMIAKHLLDHLVGFTQPVLMAPGTPRPYIPPHNQYPPDRNRPGYGQRIHIVQPGDWLSKIAITYYGDMNKWDVIYNHPENRRTIGPDYNLIKPGQRLIIPSL